MQQLKLDKIDAILDMSASNIAGVQIPGNEWPSLWLSLETKTISTLPFLPLGEKRTNSGQDSGKLLWDLN